MAQLTQTTSLHLSRSEIVSVLSGLMLAMFLASLDQTIVATSLSTMAQDLERLVDDVVGGFGLSRRHHGDYPDLRPAQRSLWPAADPARVYHVVPDRLGAVRAVADDAAADRGAGAAGYRWRRLALGLAGGGRRRDPTPRARQIPRLFRQCDGDLELVGPGAGRILLRLLVMALDLLDQPPVWSLGAHPVQPQSAAVAKAAAQAGHRLARGGIDHRGDDADPDRRRAGRIRPAAGAASTYSCRSLSAS